MRFSSKIICVVWKVSALNSTQMSVNDILGIKIRIIHYTGAMEAGKTGWIHWQFIGSLARGRWVSGSSGFSDTFTNSLRDFTGHAQAYLSELQDYSTWKGSNLNHITGVSWLRNWRSCRTFTILVNSFNIHKHQGKSLVIPVL